MSGTLFFIFASVEPLICVYLTQGNLKGNLSWRPSSRHIRSCVIVPLDFFVAKDARHFVSVCCLSLVDLKEYSVILTTSFYDMNQKI